MRTVVSAKPAGTVADHEDLDLVDLSQDVEAVKDYFGNRPAVKEFDGFLVKIDDGDYAEVYGFRGSVPYVTKPVFKITRSFYESKLSTPKKPKKQKSVKRAPSGFGGIR